LIEFINDKSKIFQNFSLKELTSFKIGGHAEYLVLPACIEDFKLVLEFIKKKAANYFIIGGGSNMLVGSGDYSGVVISTNRFNSINLENSRIIAASGADNTDIAVMAHKHCLTGCEFMYFLPGTVGGSTYMNAKCYGSEMSRIVSEVKVLTKDCEIKTYTNEEMNFTYKNSILKSTKEIVLEVILQLEKGDKSLIYEQMQSNRTDRENKKQFQFPNAGCIFKNDYENNIVIGKAISDCGIKELRVGDAEVFEQHGNFIINRGNATSSDVLKLIELVKSKLSEHYNKINVDCEIELYGNFD